MLTDFRSPVCPCVTNLPDPENNRAELSRRFEASTHIFQGLVSQLANDPKSRRREFELARKCIPDHPHVKSCEAELEQEIHDLRQLLGQYPGSTITAEHLADKLYLALQYHEAATLYEYVLRARPVPAETSYLNLARIQFAAGAAGAAEQTLLDCLQRLPRSADAHDLLAGIYLKGGRSADALRHLQQAIAFQPGDPRFQEHYAQATGGK
jgi:predicted Zn-dependent protease